VGATLRWSPLRVLSGKVLRTFRIIKSQEGDAGGKAYHINRTAEALKKLLFLPIILLLLVPVIIFLLPPREAQLESPQAFTPPPPPPPQQQIALHSLSEYKEDLASRGQSLDDQGVLIESLDGQQTFAEHNPDITFNP